MAKKRSEKKVVKGECCSLYGQHSCKIFLVKIAAMAFLLFLITIWPWLNNVLLGVHWGIYLGIVILLMIIGAAGCCKKK